MSAPALNRPRLSVGLVYRDPVQMIDWLCQAFGFALQLKVESEPGRIAYSELTHGDGLLAVGHEHIGEQRFGTDMKSPLAAGSVSQYLHLYVDDVDTHCAQARAAGARIVEEPALHDYGDDYWADRSYGALDPEGHLWWFSQRIRGSA